MSPNYDIIIDKTERYEDHVCHIFSYLLSGINSTFNHFIESTRDDWDTVIEDPSLEIIQNNT